MKNRNNELSNRDIFSLADINIKDLKQMKKEKIAFDTYEEAFQELQRIVNTNYNTCKKAHTKPSRVYEFKGKFYLTSQIKFE